MLLPVLLAYGLLWFFLTTSNTKGPELAPSTMWEVPHQSLIKKKKKAKKNLGNRHGIFLYNIFSYELTIISRREIYKIKRQQVALRIGFGFLSWLQGNPSQSGIYHRSHWLCVKRHEHLCIHLNICMYGYIWEGDHFKSWFFFLNLLWFLIFL